MSEQETRSFVIKLLKSTDDLRSVDDSSVKSQQRQELSLVVSQVVAGVFNSHSSLVTVAVPLSDSAVCL